MEFKLSSDESNLEWKSYGIRHDKNIQRKFKLDVNFEFDEMHIHRIWPKSHMLNVIFLSNETPKNVRFFCKFDGQISHF